MGINSTGYMYVPLKCQKMKCPAHYVFHGCNQDIAWISTAFIEFAGYNSVAELNDIVIVYPQAIVSTGNQYGCWDYYGFTDDGNDYYATNRGV